MSLETPSYWKKDGDKLKLTEELAWNLPEQKMGRLMILGGNSAGFSAEVRIAEYVTRKLPFFREVKNVFPDSLRARFPVGVSGLEFYEATESGGFGKDPGLYNSLLEADLAIFLGDFSRNSATAIAIGETLKRSDGIMTVLTRDSLDLLVSEMERVLVRDEVILVGSMAQMQKILRAVYYPRPLLLSQSLYPVVETLHKFTMSYPVGILTFHEGQVLAAGDGGVISVPIEKTKYSPISLWDGEVAVKVGAFRLFNQKKKLESLVAGLLY